MAADIQTIPLDKPYPCYSFTINLSEVTYTLEFFYNSRADRWRMNILDIVGNPVLMAVPLIIERDLTESYRYLKIPPGYLVVLDGPKSHTQPGLSGFMLNHALYYMVLS